MKMKKMDLKKFPVFTKILNEMCACGTLLFKVLTFTYW